MKRVLKQSVGIDVAQKELVVQIGRLYEDLSTELYAYKCMLLGFIRPARTAADKRTGR